jgi:hypothetical protein
VAFAFLATVKTGILIFYTTAPSGKGYAPYNRMIDDNDDDDDN